MNLSGDHGELLAAARSGSLDALGVLYQRHADPVYSTAYRITGSQHDAEDVLQDVFLGLGRALRSYSEQGKFEAWLRRLAARTALMHLRSHKRKREDSFDEVLLDDVSAHGPCPIAPIDLERLILTLPEQLRVVFVLKEVEGYSHAEIADVLGITANNSAVRLARAWVHLRKEAHK